ncbi:MAG: dimethyl sulfoxide reductase anchor subunit [Granulosicoccus sp.]|nr:dimethyl sulfoxide reductase anchor subunit [Granulosicoccus sp.]
MNPALSVIFFTVTAGAGYGLLFLLAITRVAQLSDSISPDQLTFMGFAGLVLVTIGLISSTFHLAKPKNAWRSFIRFRTSWLSREAVFAVLFYPVCLLWLGFEWWTGNTKITALFAVVTALLCLVVLFCTAMIYASLKTIRQWHTALTPVNFLLLGLMLGSLILALMFVQQQLSIQRVLTVSVVLVVVAALVKCVYFYWIEKPAGPTINSALGFLKASVQLLDVGHSSDTFHTKEFGFQTTRIKLLWLRIACLLLAFLIPFCLVSGVLGGVGLISLLLATISAYVGVFVERWLFFAEARHVVNLYHGMQRT